MKQGMSGEVKTSATLTLNGRRGKGKREKNIVRMSNREHDQDFKSSIHHIQSKEYGPLYDIICHMSISKVSRRL